METFAPKGQLRGMIMPDYVDQSRTLCIEARYLYAVLCDYARDKDHCWPSQHTLARRIGCSIASLKKYLGQLVAEKLIMIERALRGCKYYLLKPVQTVKILSQKVSKFIGSPSNFDTETNLKNKKKENTPPLPPALPPAVAPVARDVSSLSEAKINQDRVTADKAFVEVWCAWMNPTNNLLARFESRQDASRDKLPVSMMST